MITVLDVRRFKAEGKRFAMLTAYDHPTARILDEAGIPVLLVGDSLATNVLGYESTLPVTMEEMLHHTRAVARGARDAMVVADMPFLSYQVSVEEGIRNAGRFVKEAGAHAVKIEGPQLELIGRLVELGIPVMGHVGLTPQSVHGDEGVGELVPEDRREEQAGREDGGGPVGAPRVGDQRGEEAARRVLDQALAIEKVGAFSIVLEAIPAELAREITARVQVPTIGIGAGPHCDGQVLVLTDLLGLSERIPKLAKPYADLRRVIAEAARAFAEEVATGAFPDEAHTYR